METYLSLYLTHRYEHVVYINGSLYMYIYTYVLYIVYPLHFYICAQLKSIFICEARASRRCIAYMRGAAIHKHFRLYSPAKQITSHKKTTHSIIYI